MLEHSFGVCGGTNSTVADRLVGMDSAARPARAMLPTNDTYSFFEAMTDWVGVGTTRTNVSDFRAVRVLPRAD